MRLLILSILMPLLFQWPVMASEYHFLTEIEDVEREAWWLISNKRLNTTSSPWRAMEKAITDYKKIKKKIPAMSLCQKMQVRENENEWVITSHCLASPQELARLKKINNTNWEVEISTPAFKEHFGLQTSIFFTTLKCQLEVSAQGHLQKLDCPIYARDLNSEEWVELKNWSYSKKGKDLMKIEGTIKKQFETVATLSTAVPFFGDITVKEVRIPQKPIVEEGSLNDKVEDQKEPSPGR